MCFICLSVCGDTLSLGFYIYFSAERTPPSLTPSIYIFAAAIHSWTHRSSSDASALEAWPAWLTTGDWALERPPILDIDFPNDRSNGERAHDLWYECRRRPTDETLPVVDLPAQEAIKKQQRHERSILWKKALRRYILTRHAIQRRRHSANEAPVSSPTCACWPR